MKLVRLHDGSFVNPNLVGSVRALPRTDSEHAGGPFPARVVVKLAGVEKSIVLYPNQDDDYASAEELRDDTVRTINEALKEIEG